MKSTHADYLAQQLNIDIFTYSPRVSASSHSSNFLSHQHKKLHITSLSARVLRNTTSPSRRCFVIYDHQTPLIKWNKEKVVCKVLEMRICKEGAEELNLQGASQGIGSASLQGVIQD